MIAKLNDDRNKAINPKNENDNNYDDYLSLDFDDINPNEKGILKNGHDNFDDDSVFLLKDLLLDETQPVSYQIVISSAHRLGRTLEELKDLFKPYGLENRIVGFTPDLGFNIKRGYEIHEYLKLQTTQNPFS